MYNFLSVVYLKPSRALEYLKHYKYEGNIPIYIREHLIDIDIFDKM